MNGDDRIRVSVDERLESKPVQNKPDEDHGEQTARSLTPRVHSLQPAKGELRQVFEVTARIILAFLVMPSSFLVVSLNAMLSAHQLIQNTKAGMLIFFGGGRTLTCNVLVSIIHRSPHLIAVRLSARSLFRDPGVVPRHRPSARRRCRRPDGERGGKRVGGCFSDSAGDSNRVAWPFFHVFSLASLLCQPVLTVKSTKEMTCR